MKTILGTAFFLFLAVSPAGAQGCGYFQPCSPPFHRLDPGPDNSCNYHWTCVSCDGEGGGACHPMCTASCPVEFGFNPILQMKLVTLQEAVAAGDVDKVLRLAPEMRSYVAYNSARQSLQLRSCTGEGVIANLPLRNETQRLLALRLPSTTQMLASARQVDKTSGYQAFGTGTLSVSELLRHYLGSNQSNSLGVLVTHSFVQAAVSSRRDNVVSVSATNWGSSGK